MKLLKIGMILALVFVSACSLSDNKTIVCKYVDDDYKEVIEIELDDDNKIKYAKFESISTMKLSNGEEPATKEDVEDIQKMLSDSINKDDGVKYSYELSDFKPSKSNVKTFTARVKHDVDLEEYEDENDIYSDTDDFFKKLKSSDRVCE